MRTTTSAKTSRTTPVADRHAPRPARAQKRKESVVSVRLDTDVLAQLDELAEEMERSRSNLIVRAVRDYVEREYEVLRSVKDGEKDHAEGRSVSTSEARAWLRDRIEGRTRKPNFGQ